MWKFFLTLILSCASLAGAARPKLVVVVIIDQFRYDYLTRFRAEYKGGFDRLLTRGAVFTNATLQHFPTVTAVGHSTVLTGATPSMSGIINNEWYDRESGSRVTSVSDSAVKLLGAPGKGAASPRRLLVDTVGDELKMAGTGACKVIGVSFKDRAAVLPSGHRADGAFWFDDQTGNFVSSTFYFPDLPAWAKDFNARRVSDQFLGREWVNSADGKPFKKLPATPGQPYYDSVEKSPFGNDLLEAFAEAAISAEQLGGRGATDLLSVSFSSNDHVGHEVGPHSAEARDISIQTDRVLDKFFRFLDARLGLDNVLLVLTADHGVAPLAETLAEWKMPGGRMSEAELTRVVQTALVARFGEGKWILDSTYGTFYFNQGLIREKKLEPAEVHKTAADVLWKVPHVFRVYTREQLAAGQFGQDPVSRRVSNGFHYQRSGDVITLLDPYWSFAKTGVTHGAAFSYDTHLPLIFMGPGIRPGLYHQSVAINDIAPTLATLLDLETPSGSVGRALHEILE